MWCRPLCQPSFFTNFNSSTSSTNRRSITRFGIPASVFAFIADGSGDGGVRKACAGAADVGTHQPDAHRRVGRDVSHGSDHGKVNESRACLSDLVDVLPAARGVIPAQSDGHRCLGNRHGWGSNLLRGASSRNRSRATQAPDPTKLPDPKIGRIDRIRNWIARHFLTGTR